MWNNTEILTHSSLFYHYFLVSVYIQNYTAILKPLMSDGAWHNTADTKLSCAKNMDSKNGNTLGGHKNGQDKITTKQG